MLRGATLLALLLSACGSIEALPEAGAPPRPLPPDVKIVVIEIPLADIGGSETVGLASVPRDKIDKGDGWELGYRALGYAAANVGADGKWCRVVIAKELTGVERERVLAHEKRHCTGQQHVIRNGTVVWLP